MIGSGRWRRCVQSFFVLGELCLCVEVVYYGDVILLGIAPTYGALYKQLLLVSAQVVLTSIAQRTKHVCSLERTCAYSVQVSMWMRRKLSVDSVAVGRSQ